MTAALTAIATCGALGFLLGAFARGLYQVRREFIADTRSIDHHQAQRDALR